MVDVEAKMLKLLPKFFEEHLLASKNVDKHSCLGWTIDKKSKTGENADIQILDYARKEVLNMVEALDKLRFIKVKT